MDPDKTTAGWLDMGTLVDLGADPGNGEHTDPSNSQGLVDLGADYGHSEYHSFFAV